MYGIFCKRRSGLRSEEGSAGTESGMGIKRKKMFGLKNLKQRQNLNQNI